jgi:hypothetical protein
MYFADLQPYTCFTGKRSGYTALAVGWLDSLFPYTIGPTPPAFQERLREHCACGVHAPMLGFHECDFCGKSHIFLEYGSKKVMTNNGEIWILDGNIVYAAPVMIHHYVTDHNYRPPQVFIDAVMRCPLPYEAAYQEIMQSWGETTFDYSRDYPFICSIRTP